MNILKVLLCLSIIAAALVQQPALAQDANEPPLIVGVQHIPPEPPRFKSTSVSGQLREALEHAAATGDSWYMVFLQQQNEKQPEVLLKLLPTYLNDPSPKVRDALIDMAWWKNTRSSFDIMAALCADRDLGVRLRAIGLLEGGYSQQQVREWGGQRFHLTIKRAFLSYRFAREEALLLSLFGDKEDILLLHNRLDGFALDVKEGKTAWRNQRIAIDLALTRLGEKNARARIVQRLKSDDKEACLQLLQWLKWLPDEELLSDALELMKDKRNLYDTPRGSPGADYIASGTRLCDVTFSAFWRMMPVPEMKIAFSNVRTDAQLYRAYDYWRKNLSTILKRTVTYISKPS